MAVTPTSRSFIDLLNAHTANSPAHTHAGNERKEGQVPLYNHEAAPSTPNLGIVLSRRKTYSRRKTCDSCSQNSSEKSYSTMRNETYYLPEESPSLGSSVTSSPQTSHVPQYISPYLFSNELESQPIFSVLDKLNYPNPSSRDPPVPPGKRKHEGISRQGNDFIISSEDRLLNSVRDAPEAPPGILKRPLGSKEHKAAKKKEKQESDMCYDTSAPKNRDYNYSSINLKDATTQKAIQLEKSYSRVDREREECYQFINQAGESPACCKKSDLRTPLAGQDNEIEHFVVPSSEALRAKRFLDHHSFTMHSQGAPIEDSPTASCHAESSRGPFERKTEIEASSSHEFNFEAPTVINTPNFLGGSEEHENVSNHTQVSTAAISEKFLKTSQYNEDRKDEVGSPHGAENIRVALEERLKHRICHVSSNDTVASSNVRRNVSTGTNKAFSSKAIRSVSFSLNKNLHTQTKISGDIAVAAISVSPTLKETNLVAQTALDFGDGDRKRKTCSSIKPSHLPVVSARIAPKNSENAHLRATKDAFAKAKCNIRNEKFVGKPHDREVSDFRYDDMQAEEKGEISNQHASPQISSKFDCEYAQGKSKSAQKTSTPEKNLCHVEKNIPNKKKLYCNEIAKSVALSKRAPQEMIEIYKRLNPKIRSSLSNKGLMSKKKGQHINVSSKETSKKNPIVPQNKFVNSCNHALNTLSRLDTLKKPPTKATSTVSIKKKMHSLKESQRGAAIERNELEFDTASLGMAAISSQLEKKEIIDYGSSDEVESLRSVQTLEGCSNESCEENESLQNAFHTTATHKSISPSRINYSCKIKEPEVSGTDSKVPSGKRKDVREEVKTLQRSMPLSSHTIIENEQLTSDSPTGCYNTGRDFTSPKVFQAEKVNIHSCTKLQRALHTHHIPRECEQWNNSLNGKNDAVTIQCIPGHELASTRLNQSKFYPGGSEEETKNGYTGTESTFLSFFILFFLTVDKTGLFSQKSISLWLQRSSFKHLVCLPSSWFSGYQKMIVNYTFSPASLPFTEILPSEGAQSVSSLISVQDLEIVAESFLETGKSPSSRFETPPYFSLACKFKDQFQRKFPKFTQILRRHYFSLRWRNALVLIFCILFNFFIFAWLKGNYFPWQGYLAKSNPLRAFTLLISILLPSELIVISNISLRWLIFERGYRKLVLSLDSDLIWQLNKRLLNRGERTPHVLSRSPLSEKTLSACLMRFEKELFRLQFATHFSDNRRMLEASCPIKYPLKPLASLWRICIPLAIFATLILAIIVASIIGLTIGIDEYLATSDFFWGSFVILSFVCHMCIRCFKFSTLADILATLVDRIQRTEQWVNKVLQDEIA